MKLSQWAKKQSLTYRSAHKHFKQGLIENAYQLPSGAIIVPDDVPSKKEHNVVYARVSSSENKDNLDTQAKRVTDFCNAKGWVVHEVVKETASGLNDERPKLLKVLQDQKVTRIIVEHKDRLTRFGFNYIKLLDKEIVVINEAEDQEQDLMQDFVSLVARLYGKHRSKRATEKLIQELNK
jgi:predicted site-specific integrase-resolvase